ncbi:MAG: SufS family cysteine desulfurase [Phycisphaerae bacterium]|nr:SufS family cysteine desulfurase [Phycisphaerae bacterium]MDW8261471.1 SufS family cysteine desulfurase [Phycisphaerales bacterium]
MVDPPAAPTLAVPSAEGSARPIPLNPERVRRDFPILQQSVHGKPLIYLDNAASTQKPRAVIDAISGYYQRDHANIHRAVHTLSRRATHLWEHAREVVRRFINAREPAECIFTRGTTESINLVASCLARSRLRPGDEIVLTTLEHHSNIVPWQLAAEASGARVVAAPINDSGEVTLEDFAAVLSPRTRLVSVTWVSNALGTINPVEEMIRLVRQRAPDALFFVDAAQWVAHGPADVQKLGCDFLAFSGHKLYGPTGIGVLYGRRDVLENLPPYQGGGDMIETVAFEKTTYAQLPNRLEAGTPHIAGAVGLAAAIEYVHAVGFDAIMAHERDLLDYATARLQEVQGLRIVGTAARKAGVISFVLSGISPLDLGMKLDEQGIAVRTGHHCCMPLMSRLGLNATARASLALYNTRAEIDVFVECLHKIAAETVPSTPPAKPLVPEALRFPPPAAASPELAAQELIETFDLLGGWEQRDAYLLELGEKLLPLPQALKTEATRVHGCMSLVHLVGRIKPGSEDVIEFLADSDAHIVRGLIALLQRVYCGQRAGDIIHFDIEGLLRRLGLDQHLSMGRRNGLSGMIGRIRQLAMDLPHSRAVAVNQG